MSDPHDLGQTVDVPSGPADSLDAGLAAGFAAPRSSLGASQRPVLLKEAEGQSDLAVQPRSDAMPPAGQIGDRYQLSGEIARGGMGAVLRGRDMDLGRDLAVKVLLGRHANRPEVARRFIEEAQIGGQLQHPGVVPVYDIGRFGDRPFFTMKLVKGLTLAALLSERADASVDRPRLLNIALQVSQALAYAHAKGVIHRDLKPANIMVGAFGEVQVMDWGLAKVLAEGGTADEERASRQHQPDEGTRIQTARSSGSAGCGTDTEAGSLLGTPAYMPPEQANGEVALMDRRADVFGLGAILCEILTGKPPYVGRSSDEVRRKAANGDLADALMRLGACGADHELIALTRSCLSPEVIDRPGDARAVAEGLTAYLDGVQERLRQAELAEAEARAKAVEEAKRRRLTMALAGTVLLALTLGGGSWLYVKSERDARQAKLTREVNDALNKATTLREKARTAPTGGAVLLAQAREQAQRALALVENGPADEALKDKVTQMQAELDEEQKDRKLVTALDEARLAQAGNLAGQNSFTLERAVPKFREAFRAWGLPVGRMEARDAAARIRGRPAAVREAIVAALDEWHVLAETPNAGTTRAQQNWLRAVLDAAEPQDGWTRRLRAARQQMDEPGQGAALAKLAAEADVRKVPARSLTLLALMLEFAGARGDAVRLLRRAQRQYPSDFWVNQLLGIAYQERVKPPQYGEAVRYMTAAVALRPDSPGTRFNLGLALYHKGRLDEAIASLKKAIELDPKDARAHSTLGNALKDKGRVDEAIACYKKAIDLDPKYAKAHTGLGAFLCDVKKDYDGAIASFKKAIALDPKDVAAHANLGIALSRKGRVDEAIARFKKAIELDPKYTNAHINLGVVLSSVKRDYDGAIECFRKAIALDQKYSVLHFNLGTALQGKGRLDEAIASYRKAIDLDPKYVAAHSSLGLALAHKGRLDGAIASFKKAIELDPKHAATHTNLGVTLYRKGRLDEAIASYKKAVALDPKRAAPHRNLGVALADKGRLDGAIASLKKAIELDPEDAVVHNNLGNTLRRKGEVDEAIASFKKAITRDPKYSEAHFNLGNALSGKGRHDEAIASFKKAIALDPKHAAAHINLGALLCDVKRDYDGAIASFKKAIALDPKGAKTHHNLGTALAGKGKIEEAIASYKKAVELDPKLAEVHISLGNALSRKGRLDEAIASYKKAIELNPKHAIPHGALGLALLRQGRFTEARDASARALGLIPDKNPLRALVSRQLQTCERLVKLEARLPRLLAGKDKPASVGESLDLAQMCAQKRTYAAAARFYAGAFAADPKVAADLKAGVRYNAACSAALAAAGKGKDADKLDDKERTRLRQQALDWLKADLALWTKQMQSGKPADRAAVRRALSHWQKDSDLAGIRDKTALAELPADEQKTLAQLWSDVAALLKKAEEKPD